MERAGEIRAWNQKPRARRFSGATGWQRHIGPKSYIEARPKLLLLPLVCAACENVHLFFPEFTGLGLPGPRGSLSLLPAPPATAVAAGGMSLRFDDSRVGCAPSWRPKASRFREIVPMYPVSASQCGLGCRIVRHGALPISAVPWKPRSPLFRYQLTSKAIPRLTTGPRSVIDPTTSPRIGGRTKVAAAAVHSDGSPHPSHRKTEGHKL